MSHAVGEIWLSLHFLGANSVLGENTEALKIVDLFFLFESNVRQ